MPYKKQTLGFSYINRHSDCHTLHLSCKDWPNIYHTKMDLLNVMPEWT